jgi:hypothetical protein
MNDVGADFAGDFFQPAFQLLHQGQFFANGQLGQGAGG